LEGARGLGVLDPRYGKSTRPIGQIFTLSIWIRGPSLNRLVPKDDKATELLAKRTLTNLYNERPTWLDLAHRKLDEAVFAPYGWEGTLSDDEILTRLLAINQQRAATEPPAD
jgi:hypothetical protein